MKFKNDTWIDLKTEKIDSGRYKAYTPGYSGFAIVGVTETKTPTMPAITPTITATQAETTKAPTATPTAKTSGFEIALGIAALSVIHIFGRKRR